MRVIELANEFDTAKHSKGVSNKETGVEKEVGSRYRRNVVPVTHPVNEDTIMFAKDTRRIGKNLTFLYEFAESDTVIPLHEQLHLNLHEIGPQCDASDDSEKELGVRKQKRNDVMISHADCINNGADVSYLD